jgi:hypothetical protein
MAYQFKKPEDKEFKLLPDGEYIVQVESVDRGINAGDDERDMKFSVEGHTNKLFDSLIERNRMDWKTDRFVECMGMVMEPDANGNCPFFTHFTEDALTGLRGWVRVKTEEYNGKKRNKIDAYLINKPKLAKHIELDAPPVPEDDVPF